MIILGRCQGAFPGGAVSETALLPALGKKILLSHGSRAVRPNAVPELKKDSLPWPVITLLYITLIYNIRRNRLFLRFILSASPSLSPIACELALSAS